MRAFASMPLQGKILHGELDPIQGWVSPDYGQRRPASVVVYAASLRLPFRIITLLTPVPSSGDPNPAVSPIMEGEHQIAGLVLEDGTIHVTEQEIIMEGKPWPFGGVKIR